MLGVGDHVGVGLVGLGLFFSPEVDLSGFCDESEGLVVGFVVWSCEEADDAFAGGECGVVGLGSDLDGAVVAGFGVCEGDGAVVGGDV